MDFTRLGILDLFGILTPGAFLLGNIIIISVVIGKSAKLSLFDPFLSIVAIFFISYLFGTILRLVNPGRVDGYTSLYFKHIKGYKGDWVDDKFPYIYHLLKVWPQKREKDTYVMSEISDFILKELGLDKMDDDDLKEYSKKEEHTGFFNYCKVFLTEKSPRLSDEVYRAEALTRLLAGIFWVSLGSLLTFLVIIFLNIITIWITLNNESFWLIGFFSLMYLFIIQMILKRFRTIRFKEVQIVWYSFYLMNKEKLHHMKNS